MIKDKLVVHIVFIKLRYILLKIGKINILILVHNSNECSILHFSVFNINVKSRFLNTL